MNDEGKFAEPHAYRGTTCGVDNVSALSDARKMESADQKALVRAFDKAVRRKPLAFAADAVGLWELHVGKSGPRTAGA
jgi:hypothetical protein